MMHTSDYKSATVFAGKRVLVIGAGNSGCDIAVDAVHHAASVDISVRRGYHFVPKYLFGKPADTLNQGKPLPPRIKQAVDCRVLRMFTGDPTRFGFPEPDHKIYESHPIVNTLVLHHLGHGDIRVRADVERFDGRACCSSTARGDYDLVVLATGYRLHYPFVDPALSTGPGWRPTSTSTCSRRDRTLFVLGMIEASGIGWQGRYEQAELVAACLTAREVAPERAARSRPGAAGRGPTCRAATTTSGSSGWPTTSTRTPTGAPWRRESSGCECSRMSPPTASARPRGSDRREHQDRLQRHAR